MSLGYVEVVLSFYENESLFVIISIFSAVWTSFRSKFEICVLASKSKMRVTNRHIMILSRLHILIY
jgi:hypothetical protein